MDWMVTGSILHLDSGGNPLLLIFHTCVVPLQAFGGVEATENPSPSDGPEIRAGMRNEKRKNPSSTHCGWNRVAVGKVDLFTVHKYGPYLLTEFKTQVGECRQASQRQY